MLRVWVPTNVESMAEGNIGAIVTQHFYGEFLRARILEWVAISFSRGSSQHRDWTWVSCIAGRFFTVQTTSEATSMEKGEVSTFAKHLHVHYLKWFQNLLF